MSVYVSQVTPSPTDTTISYESSQNGCLSNSGSCENRKPNEDCVRTNGTATSGSSLENSCSSQDTHDMDLHQERGRGRALEDGVREDCGGMATEKGVGVTSGHIEGTVPKIMTSKLEIDHRHHLERIKGPG